MEYLAFGCQLLVALVFAVSVASKLRGDRREFVESTRKLLGALLPSGRASTAAARIVAPVVVAAEAAVVVLLIPAPSVALALAGLLLAAFGVAIALALRRGVAAPCRCFGGSARLSGWHLVRNALLLGAVAAGLTLDPGPFGAAEAAGLAVTAGAALAAAVVVIRLEELGELFGPRLS
ncbi:Methylamine utilisation protein MauE [Nonomuraea maritima]|uniref:Methylamine utilisation protein MauE n=1 Tax=Nonomuraea maritima TaxID=683260 RepID=A0A1G9P2T6_9ACTN|nr:MauE/DoxX family redox-associated membrane protein [Nonomuraea maritima]SDL92990.1 Methylamine utilisation protein MauE [Nonomuraea maritima]